MNAFYAPVEYKWIDKYLVCELLQPSRIYWLEGLKEKTLLLIMAGLGIHNLLKCFLFIEFHKGELCIY